MTTLTQTQLRFQKETVIVNGTTCEVDLHLTDWKAYYASLPMVTMLADLYSVEFDPDSLYPVPAWNGVVACTVAEPTEEAVKNLIRSFSTLSSLHYHIGQIWKPGTEDEI
jgi:hypothetical protein